MNNRGILIVLSGFSGAGKGTVVKNILKTPPDGCAVLCLQPQERQEKVKPTAEEYFFKSTSEIAEIDCHRRTDRICAVRGQRLRHTAPLCGRTA